MSTTTIAPQQAQHQSQQQPRQGFFRTMWRLLRQLFHEITGALFAVLAIACVNSAVRAWRHGEPRWTMALPIAYAAMMVYFSVTSFFRARRVR